jgi:hypothetical protein
MPFARTAARRWGLLLLVAALPVVCAARAPPSIDASFEVFWRSANSQPFARQEQIWDRLIEASRRDLYDAVVWEKQDHPDWSARKQRLLQSRFALYPQLAARIPEEARALRATIAAQSLRFRTLFPDADLHPPVELVLAPNFDAKSGVLSDGMPVLVFAVDSLLLEKAKLDIVVPHELFHLYDAQHAGIRNDGVMPGVDLTLPLFEEGLATYVSGQLSPGHSDGELLLQDDLGQIPASRLQAVAGRFLDDAHDKAIDPAHPEAFRRWFNAASTSYQRDLPNRAGYWLGLQLIRHLRRRYSLAQIAAWSPTQAEAHVVVALKQLSANG